MTNRIIRVVFDSDLRCSHDGLRLQAKELKVNVDTLTPGEYVVFINHKKTMLKIFAAGNTLAHFRTPDNRKLDLRVISMIPTYFNGQKFRYDDALKATLEKHFNVARGFV